MRRLNEGWLVFILLYLLAWCGASLHGQSPTFWTLGSEDGLPSQTVYRILQAQDGFIWMATEGGLCRYTGAEFQLIDSPELITNEILNIKEDAWGRVWFLNLSSQIGYVQHDSMTVLDLSSGQKETDRILDFFLTKDQLLIFALDSKAGKLFKVRMLANGALEPPEQPQKLRSFSASWVDEAGKIYLHTPKGVVEYDQELGHGIALEQTESTVNYTFNMEALDSNLFLLNNGTKMTLAERGQSRQTILEFKPFTRINHIYPHQKNIYLLTKRGLGILDKESFDWMGERLFLKDYQLNTICIDREGNAWFGTAGDGVLVIPSFSVQEYSKRSGDLPTDRITMVYKDPQKDQVWIGTENGQLGTLTNRGGDPPKYTKVKDFAVEEEIISMLEYSDQEYLVNVGGTLFFTDHQFTELQLATGNYKAMIKCNQGALWLGWHAGVLRLENAKERDFSFSKSDLDYFLNARTYALHFSKDQKIWMGSVSGLYYYSYEQDSVFSFREQGAHYNYRVTKIKESTDGVIWVSTLGDGILKIKDGVIIEKFTTQTGLTSNRCNDLLIDGPILWVATDKGVDRYDWVRKTAQHLDNLDGLPTNEVTFLEKLDHTVILGTPKGLVVFPDTLSGKNEWPPDIYLEKLVVAEKERPLANESIFTYKENNITVQFASLNYRSQGKTHYQYRLLGLNAQWSYTKNRQVQFLSLSPGTYQLEAIAFNEDEVPSETPAVFSFTIEPPWWGTWWFRGIIGAATLLGGWSYLRYRYRLVRKKELEEKNIQDRIASLRMQALQAQMNPHFTFNALNAIQQFLATNQREAAMIHLADFANLIRTIFEQSKNKVISFEEELHFLNIYLGFEKLRFGDKVEIVCQVDPILRKQWMDYQLPPLLIQPIVENTFRHGLMHKKNGGLLEIIFAPKGDFLSCTIRDNGVGRDRTQALKKDYRKEHISTGIKATKERLHLWHKTNRNDLEGLVINDLKNSNGESLGTEVLLTI